MQNVTMVQWNVVKQNPITARGWTNLALRAPQVRHQHDQLRTLCKSDHPVRDGLMENIRYSTKKPWSSST